MPKSSIRTFTENPQRLPGTRPGGAHTEREASARVRQMFSRIAPRYDFLNHLLSFSLDRVWRRRTALKFRRTLRRTDARVLDICCGTGDLTFALERVRVRELRDATAHRTPLFGSDFAQPMLDRAHKKAAAHSRSVIFTTADALNLPFADSSFDLVTTAFGFRNLVNYEAGLREFAHVLKPGGELAILEFSEPGVGMTGGMFVCFCGGGGGWRGVGVFFFFFEGEGPPQSGGGNLRKQRGLQLLAGLGRQISHQC